MFYVKNRAKLRLNERKNKFIQVYPNVTTFSEPYVMDFSPEPPRIL